MQISWSSWSLLLLHNTVGSVICRYLGRYFTAQYCRQHTIQISRSLLCCTILQAAYYVDILVVTLLHNIVGNVIFRYLGHYFAAQYCRQRTMQISWSLLCYTILQAAYYVDILVVTLMHNTVGRVIYRYLGRYFAAQYCRQRTMSISWSLLYCTILQAVYYVDNLVVTLLHNTVASVLCRYLGSSVLCRYLGRYFAAQYCRQRTMQIIWSLLCCTILQQRTMQSFFSHYFAAQYCRQRTMQISWLLFCCTIQQAAYYVDILVITLLHNIIGSVLCRYLGHYFAAQYFRQRTMLISWSILCCTIMQEAYYVDILVITLLHNIVGSVLCRYLGHYFTAQYCRQRTMYISWSLLCCTILQAAYYVDNLVITLLHNSVGSVLCRYLGCSILCIYLGRYFAAQYCRQHTMQIIWSLLCCTILQSAYYVDILVVTCCTILQTAYYVDIQVVTLLHNTVDSVLC